MINFEELQENVLDWADTHDLLKSEYAEKQFLKFVEEVFEFKTELDFKESRLDSGMNFSEVFEPMQLEMGDVFVTLIILCDQLDIDPVDCLGMAYDKIKYRKGHTINGTFIKEEDL